MNPAYREWIPARERRRHKRSGTAADQNAYWAHQSRINPRPTRYTSVTYAMRIEVNTRAVERNGGMPNLSNRWYFANGKRGGQRRRYTPYWTE